MPAELEIEEPKLPGAPPDDPPTAPMTEKQAVDEYDDADKDAAFEDEVSAEMLAKELGIGETSKDDADATEPVTDAAEETASDEPVTEEVAVDPHLLEAARGFGLDDQLIGALGDGLQQWVTNRHLQAAKQQPQQSAPDAAPQPTPAPKVEPEAFKFEIDPNMLEEDVRVAIQANMQRMDEQHRAEFASLRKEYGDVRAQMDAQAKQAQNDSLVQERIRFDEWVASQKNGTLFGEGASTSMNYDSAEYRARRDVWDMKDTLVAGINARGGTLPPERTLLEWANNSVHAQSNGKQAVTAVGKTLTKSAGQTLARAGTSQPRKVSKLDELDAGYEEMRLNAPGGDVGDGDVGDSTSDPDSEY